jgi:hypothetical protein
MKHNPLCVHQAGAHSMVADSLIPNERSRGDDSLATYLWIMKMLSLF